MSKPASIMQGSGACYLCTGGSPLMGKVKVSGAKNAVLPIMAATILASEGECRLEEVPRLEDVYAMKELLGLFGVKAEYDREERRLITSGEEIDPSSSGDLVTGRLRASFLVMGPLLARCGFVRLALPGGCAIGTRPIDLHLKGFEAMGARIEVKGGCIEAAAPLGGLKGANIYLDFPSVGATENLLMAASLAKGHTVIENPAQEPEIVDLANFLNMMGAKIRGAGTGVIRIEGKDKLAGKNYTIIPDRIEAGTYMVAAAMTRGDVFVEGAISEHLKPVVAKLTEAGARVMQQVDGIRVVGVPLRGIDIKTLPYPGFPTDMQAQFMAMLSVAGGVSTITETVFENRFMHVEELRRMGARIKVNGRTATIEGVDKLYGAPVKATDLRAGAAMVLAGLAAEGETTISYIHHIDRGYDSLVEKLTSLGASINRVQAAGA